MKFWIILCLLSVPVLHAQDAKVVPLNPADTHKAEKLYQEMKDAEKNWQDFQEQIKKSYILVGRDDPDASGDSLGSVCLYNGPCQYFRDGFDGGNFEFSKDFKFIVPKPAPPTAVAPCNINAGCFTIGPAINSL